MKRTDVLYFKGGLSLNKVTGDDVGDMKDYMKNGIGYDAVVGFQKSFSFLPDLYWGMEAGLGTRGFKASASEGGEKYTERMLDHAVKVTPFHLGYRLRVLEPIVFDFHYGLFASFDLFGSAKEIYEGSYDDYTDTTKMSEYEDFRRFDVGVNPGLTVWYGNVGVDLTYQRGLIGMFEDEDVYASNLLLRLALRF